MTNSPAKILWIQLHADDISKIKFGGHTPRPPTLGCLWQLHSVTSHALEPYHFHFCSDAPACEDIWTLILGEVLMGNKNAGNCFLFSTENRYNSIMGHVLCEVLYTHSLVFYLKWQRCCLWSYQSMYGHCDIELKCTTSMPFLVNSCVSFPCSWYIIIQS